MSTHHTYLLEVGTEELPVPFLQTAPAELKTALLQWLADAHLSHDTLDLWVTARRIALKLSGLPSQQPTQQLQIKGPPARIAWEASGELSKAGLGFCKKQGIDPASLNQQANLKTIDGEDYLTIEQTVEGKPVSTLLAEKMPELVLALTGSHFMRWGSLEERFSRPIRWVVSLWDNDVLPLQLTGIQAGRTTRGHRVLSQNAHAELSIQSPETYVSQLAEVGAVTVDPAQRQERIVAGLHAEAQRLGGVAHIDPELLELVSLLVEAPNVISGSFDAQFLKLPPAVIETVMTAHQKYFPVRAKAGSPELLNHFLVVSNGDPNKRDLIAHGNERVLKARLEDARFFYDEDRKTPLANMLESIHGITFQKGVGTLKDKAQRLEVLSVAVAKQLGLSEQEQQWSKRAALLSKSDLATHLVRELTELQGEMGQHYARCDGEPEAVATAIFEQYLPRFAGETVAKTPVGMVLSIADKLDTITAVFSQQNAKFPSGSKDPLGLRRLTNGLLLTVMDNQLTLDLEALVETAYQTLGEFARDTQEATLERVRTFSMQRLRGLLQQASDKGSDVSEPAETGYRYDMLDAVLKTTAPGSVLCDLTRSVDQLNALQYLMQTPARFMPIYEAANRTGRILGDEALEATPAEQGAYQKALKTAHLIEPAEKALAETLAAVEPALCQSLSIAHPAALTRLPAQSYDTFFDALTRLSAAVSAFFEGVMVNAEDPAVRENRRTLLKWTFSLYRLLCWFPVLVVQTAEAADSVVAAEGACSR